jgi:hypothetical protein
MLLRLQKINPPISAIANTLCKRRALIDDWMDQCYPYRSSNFLTDLCRAHLLPNCKRHSHGILINFRIYKIMPAKLLHHLSAPIISSRYSGIHRSVYELVQAFISLQLASDYNFSDQSRRTDSESRCPSCFAGDKIQMNL